MRGGADECHSGGEGYEKGWWWWWGETSKRSGETHNKKCHSDLTFKKSPPALSGRCCSWPLEKQEGSREKMIDVCGC